MHTDGSVFSFNVLLNPPADFDGGGTYFEATRRTVATPREGCAVGHSGQARHGGVAVTRGERYLLVGFVSCATRTYKGAVAGEMDPEVAIAATAAAVSGGSGSWGSGVAAAAAAAFYKFGDGAWSRDDAEGAPPGIA